MIDLYPLVRPLLFALHPEAAHSITLRALNGLYRMGCLSIGASPSVAADPVSIMGLTFPNRVGVAAGLDKNAVCVDALHALGFGFVEVGTVTAKPQPGNPRPRIFRLRGDAALINRMGFPNEGALAICRRLKQRRERVVCGINIGKNASTALNDAVTDYTTCLAMVYADADYVAVNISSPNTRDLRKLQERDQLLPLIDGLLHRRVILQRETGRVVPMLVKLTSDLSDEQVTSAASIAVEAGIDGLIVSNTTLRRDQLRSREGNEAGGLSGAPLRERALEVVRCIRAAIGSSVPLMGVGGIASGSDALAMRVAGADLVQIYTALVYRGPRVVSEIVAALADKHSA